ncbi:Bax inhibitor-1/YccA family protein [Roseiterribacter gracilis]|uniref:Membrane protein n=1 Tax=Roseiterribacter gracilis TaxID=2812848 RepID=A0A8S8XIK2_9PROT|nr:membrane protein [Rhodospirillales bacterium TMPK1]
MSFDLNPRYAQPGLADRASFDAGLRAHMLRVYNYMAGGLALSGVVAALIAFSPEVRAIFFSVNPQTLRPAPNLLYWVAVLAPIGLIFWMSFGAQRMQFSTMRTVYWVFTALQGVSLSMLLLHYTGASVAQTFFVTAAAFAGLSLYGYTTKRDLSGFATFLIMGLIGLMIASIVNIFLHSSGLNFIISAAGVLIFAGLTAWDTQRIKEQYSEAYGSESAGKLAVWGALSLYLDFINLFQFLLSFMGQRRD